MAINFDYDFSGWATKANVKCFDGLTIAPNAFKDCDGKVVPVVWNHDHSAPESVLGHALLQNRKEGVYAYVKLNDTSSGQTAKACVDNGDIDAMSIYANGIQKAGRTVMHGMIKELSLVIAGCNPGALIDEVVKHSADGTEEDSSEAFIYTDSGLSLKHGLDPDDNLLEDEDLQHSDDSSEGDKEKKGETKMADANEKTVKQVFDTLTEEQKNVVYAIIGSALDDGKDGEGNDNNDGEEEKTMHHCFENKKDGTVLKHSLDEINNVVKGAKTSGTMKAAFANAGIEDSEVDALCHGIDNIDYLFPEDHLLDNPPRIIDTPDDWVSDVMSTVHHVPFSRIKSQFADLTTEEARAKGYMKGNYKTEEVFGLLRRSTGPTTVYKKQELDRDDVIDITTFDVVAWLRNEMRYKLNRELALAYLLGDGRTAATRDKIDENCIRPVLTDADLFTIRAGEKYNFTPEAYFYPPEFGECDGSAEVAPGVTISQQKRKPFGLTWQTLIGSDEDDELGFTLHLVWGATASPSERSHESYNDSPDAETFSWDCDTTPVKVTGYKPTAHMELDSTKVPQAKMEKLLNILYGTANTTPYLPLPDEVIKLMTT